MELSSYDGVENLCQTVHDAYQTHQGQAFRILLENAECRREFSCFDVAQYKLYEVHRQKAQEFCYKDESAYQSESPSEERQDLDEEDAFP